MMAVTSWKNFKARLVDTGRLAAAFAQDVADSWPAPKTVAYDPLLIDEHLGRLSTLVGRALDLRKDIRELEILAVRTAAEYELFLLTAPLNETIERRVHQGPARSKQAASEADAATKFGVTGPLEAGFAQVSIGRAESLALEVSAIEEIDAAIVARWKHQAMFEEGFHARSVEPGNAHNYEERATNLQRLMGQQIEEALERAVALRIGLETIYNYAPPPFPDPVTLALLDDFALWLLDVERAVALLREHEGVYEITVPLLQPWGREGKALVDAEAFARALTGKPLTFELRKDVFWGEPVRLSSFGLAFGNRADIIPTSGVDAVQTSDSFVRIAARVEAPPQRYADGVSRPRVRFFLGNVGAHVAGSADAIVSGAPVTNLDPMGEWRIDLEPWIVWKDAGAYKLSAGVKRDDIVRDLKVTLRFRPIKT